MQTKKNRSEPYDKAAHTLELQAAGVPTRLYTAQSGEELLKLIHAEVELMEADPLTEDGRQLLKYWLDNAGVVAGVEPGATQQARHLPPEMYQALYLNHAWKDGFRQLILSALHDVLAFHVRLSPEMLDAVSLLVSPDGEQAYFHTEPEAHSTWWQTRLRQSQGGTILVKTQDPKKPIVRTLTACHETAKHLFSLLNTTAAESGTKDAKDGWTVGKMSVIEWGKSLKYPIDDVMETFSINGELRWKDIEVLMNADGDYVEMPKGFPQRFNKGDCHRLIIAAFRAEEKSPKGQGRYRLLK